MLWRNLQLSRGFKQIAAAISTVIATVYLTVQTDCRGSVRYHGQINKRVIIALFCYCQAYTRSFRAIVSFANCSQISLSLYPSDADILYHNPSLWKVSLIKRREFISLLQKEEQNCFIQNSLKFETVSEISLQIPPGITKYMSNVGFTSYVTIGESRADQKIGLVCTRPT